MVSEKTIKIYKLWSSIGDIFSATTLSKKLGLSKPIITNLISTLLSRKMIAPIGIIRKGKWYRRVK